MQATDISSFFCPTRLYMGVGAHREIGGLVRRHACKRLFIAMDGALRDTEFVAGIQAMLAEANVESAIFSDIEPDPSAHTVARAFEACQAHGATMLLAIGGGSTMDVAKAVGILATNGGRIHDYEGIEKFSTPPLPLIAIPTTAGTGSEVSGSCVITDTDKNLKMSIRHAALNPAAFAILDPLALRTVPAHVAAHSGMDAFVHAFESYISRKANLVTDAINLQAIGLLAANIRPFVANRENLEAGLNMLCGSALAGITFGQTGLGNVHCMARFVGAFFHLSHGLSNALCLPHVARFNLPANPAKFARIAAALDRPTRGLPEMDAAHAAVVAIEALCRDLGIPARLRDAGVTPERFDEMARLCTEAGYNRWNPRHTTTADFRALFEQAY
ncbi:iron-containing alcohol dehydrogenase [Bordetella genomosp. 9]|nr:iron-containing alcohol dehydrogenase [Bordetella genomosp. 9]